MKNHTRNLLTLAAPIALAQLANMLMGLVDSFVVGKVSAEALGGVAVGVAVFNLFAVLSIGVLMGLDFFIARAYGAQEFEETRHYSIQGLWIAIFLSIPFTACIYLAPLFLRPFGITEAVTLEATKYLHALALSLPFFLIFIALRQSLQALGVVQSVFWGLMIANLLNLLGNQAWVLGKWGFTAYGIEGSGWATTFSRLFLVAWTFYFWFKKEKELSGPFTRVSLAPEMKRIREILSLGIPSGLHFLLEVGIFVLATLLIARRSATELAAHQIVIQIASTTFMIPIGVSAAAATLVGQFVGAREFGNARQMGTTAIRTIAIINSISALLIFFGRVPLLRSFSPDPNVLAVGTTLAVIAAIFQIGDGIQAVAAGALRGIGHTKPTMVYNFLGHWALGLPLALFLGFYLGYGAIGIWASLAFSLSLVAIALTMVWLKRSRALNASVETLPLDPSSAQGTAPTV